MVSEHNIGTGLWDNLSTCPVSNKVQPADTGLKIEMGGAEESYLINPPLLPSVELLSGPLSPTAGFGFSYPCIDFQMTQGDCGGHDRNATHSQ
jgi:hypothetical protein